MTDASSARIGEVFHVSYKGKNSDGSVRSYLQLTRGGCEKPADHQKGIFFYKQFKEPGRNIDRLPAFIFHSNPFKIGTEETPWADVVDPDSGYCLFHGDNRQAASGPLTSRGNEKFVEYIRFYTDPTLRKYAPPVLIFEQVFHEGTTKGYRRFAGFGIPARFSLSTQKEKAGNYFTNLVTELVLFRLDEENGGFPWQWIDKRRNPKLTADEVLKFAPVSWRNWVRGGPLAIESCRRTLAFHKVVKPTEQYDISAAQRDILEQIRVHYDKTKHQFEGLASLVVQEALGSNCFRGWVTKRSGDGGIDFVCRLIVGEPADRLARTSAVVLGQAKCIKSDCQIGGHDLARVVARLQRGWIGAFVTTGMYSQAAQKELLQDNYPMVLINGRRLARIVSDILIKEHITLGNLLEREDTWYADNMSYLSPVRILEEASGYTPLSPSSFAEPTA